MSLCDSTAPAERHRSFIIAGRRSAFAFLLSLPHFRLQPDVPTLLDQTAFYRRQTRPEGMHRSGASFCRHQRSKNIGTLQCKTYRRRTFVAPAVSGTSPLAFPNWVSALNMETNGTLLTPELARFLKERHKIQLYIHKYR